MAVLGLCHFARMISNCGEWGLFLVAVLGLPIEVASLAVEHRLSSCGARGIFLDQGSNSCPLHWQVDSYPLCHQGSPCFCLFFFFLMFDHWFSSITFHI